MTTQVYHLCCRSTARTFVCWLNSSSIIRRCTLTWNHFFSTFSPKLTDMAAT